MHAFRFVAAVVLVELIVLTGVALERRQLQLRGQITGQRERIQLAKEQRAERLMRIGRLTAAPRMVDQTGGFIDQP